MSDEASVADSTCTACTGTSSATCTAGTCARGYHTYDAGTGTCTAAACPDNTVGVTSDNTVVTGCRAVAGYTGTISVVSSDTGFTGSAVACGAGTYKSVVGTDACIPCLTLCDAHVADAGDAYTVCPEASVSDSTKLDGSCDFTSLFGLIEDNTATATLLNTLSTAAYGAAELCQKRETLLRCRTVNDAMEAADLVIDSACGGR